MKLQCEVDSPGKGDFIAKRCSFGRYQGVDLVMRFVTGAQYLHSLIQ